jgi:RimJ/RimL family protein N-acetyltransferase
VPLTNNHGQNSRTRPLTPRSPGLKAFIEPWNTGSIRVAETAGFQREGLMRSFAPLGGIRKDTFLYARITDDAPGSRP